MTRVSQKQNVQYSNMEEKLKAEGRYKPRKSNVPENAGSVSKKTTTPLHKMNNKGLSIFKSTDMAAKSGSKGAAKAGKALGLTGLLNAVCKRPGLTLAIICGIGLVAGYYKDFKDKASKISEEVEPEKPEEIVLPEPEVEETAEEEKSSVESESIHQVKVFTKDTVWGIAKKHLEEKAGRKYDIHNNKDNNEILDLVKKIVESNKDNKNIKTGGLKWEEDGKTVIIHPNDILDIQA